MTKTFLALGFILLFLQGYATNVSGLIATNTTWTKANSPYIVTGNIAIDTGATLTVEPGVTIKFDGNYFFVVYGRLSMQGTITDTIRVTSNKIVPTKGDYPGIDYKNFKHPNDTAYFSYCHFSYSNAGININVTPTSAIIKNCVFMHCGTGVLNGWSGGTNYINVDRCYFNHNGSGVYSHGPTVVTNSTILNSNFYGIIGDTYNSGNVAVNNILYNNYNGIIKYNTVTNNIITHSGKIGIGNSANLTNNQVWYSGIGVYDCINIDHNGIEYNNYGIQYISGGTVHNNCIAYNKTLNIDYVHQDIDMSNNYWGTLDSTTIANSIDDFYDKLSGGRVVFMPLLSSPDSGCADTVSIPDTTTNSTSIAFTNTSSQLKVYPNPSSAEVTIAAPSAINEIAVYNMTGERIISITPVTNTVQINIAHLPAGYYLYKVVLKNEETIIGKIQRE